MYQVKQDKKCVIIVASIDLGLVLRAPLEIKCLPQTVTVKINHRNHNLFIFSWFRPNKEPFLYILSLINIICIF